jgi:glucose-1-phosphate adenylyltransferase
MSEQSSAITSRTLTFVLAGGEGQRLHPLTRQRAKPVVPLGGIYRLIDFTLSNCLNSGLRRVHILTQYQSESLHSHVRALNGRIASSHGRDDRLVCCPNSGKRYRGTADAVFQNLPSILNARPDFVVILCADHVYRMDYRELLRFHVDRGADVTLAAVECPSHAASQFGVLEADSTGRVVGFEEKPNQPKPVSVGSPLSLVNMGVYVFNTRTLWDALSDDAGRNTTHDFGKDIIPSLVRAGKVSVYDFTQMGVRFGSYWRDVGTLDAYYRVNMELLLSSFFDPYTSAGWPLVGLDAKAAGPVSIAPCSQVIRSVLSPNVRIEDSAKVRSSILLHNVRVGSGARIWRAIIDENVEIENGAEIGYDINKDSEYGLVTQGGIVVIPANTVVRRHKLHTRERVHEIRAFPSQSSLQLF